MPERRGAGAQGQGGWYSVVREVGLALVVAGVVVLLFVAYDLVGTNLSAQQSQSRLAREFAAALSHNSTAKEARPARRGSTNRPHDGQRLNPGPAKQAQAGPAAAARLGQRGHSGGSAHEARPVQEVSISVPPGAALDHLVIPAIGVNRYVVEGVQEQDLQLGPGHYPGTPLPGQPGNVAIAGHRTTFGAPFFRLNELRRGDLIYLTDLSGTTWVYSVRQKWVVPPSDVAVLDPTRGTDLTLTTCNPRFWATTRLVVRAMLVEHFSPGARFAGGLPAQLEVARAARSSRAGAAPAAVGQASHPVSRTHGTTARAAGSTGLPQGGGADASQSQSRAVSTGGNAPRGSAPRGTGAGSGSPRPASTNPASTNPASASPASASAASTALALGGPGPGTWAGAIGFGALAVAVWVLARLAAARRPRYAKVALLLAGALVSLVPLWFAFGAAVDLLPANF